MAEISIWVGRKDSAMTVVCPMHLVFRQKLGKAIFNLEGLGEPWQNLNLTVCLFCSHSSPWKRLY